MTLAMNDELEPAFLPRFVTRLRERAPQVRIASVRLDRASLERDLASGRLDLAVDVAQPTGADLRHTLLQRDTFCVVSARKRRLDVEAYLAARHVTVSSRRTGLAFEDLLLSRLGYQREVSVRCQHPEAACHIVAGSDLLLTMPRRHAEALNAPLGNHLLPMPVELPPVELHLYWHRQVDGEPRSQWLRTELLGLSEGLREDVKPRGARRQSRSGSR
ncbi:LysR substrate-binding domain-containing protein [Archangium lansingense]|uniref:LysR substrate-binding domain-containing protein n=1 Tax=Archangium lansingense TaxID=2995310 RepID=A0ABT4A8D0_9BACT|nr:LysR substrate-binding domain-containing protein [Archangium lansinium]MCY1077909.1 LysR substrate-binding domain-containing protein [Archangium lansinium]